MEKLIVFALRDNYYGYRIEDDFEKVKAFRDELSLGFLLKFSGQMTDLANQLKDINYVINVLEDFKKESFFKLNKTTYNLDWRYSSKEKEGKPVTLPIAKKMFKETKLKYDTLLEVIYETYRTHDKKFDGTIIDPNEFLTEIEI